MVFIHDKCITKKVYHKIKHRILNKTRKKFFNIRILKQNPNKFLTLHELYNNGNETNTNCDSNAIVKYSKLLMKNKIKLHKSYRKRMNELHQLKESCINHIGEIRIYNIQKKLYKSKQKHKELLEIDVDSYIYKELGNQYENYKIAHFCKHYDILHVDSMREHFDYFDMRGFSYNPSNLSFSFCIDFLGNRNYHFFIKDLYSNQIKLIPLHRKHESFISIHQKLNRSNIIKQMNDNYFWIDNDTILYIANNKYYNTTTCYSYHIPSNKRKLVYKCNEHRELNLYSLHSGFYFILVSSSYHSDEVFVIDILDHYKDKNRKQVKCIEQSILKDKPFILYPYIDHIDASWYILKDDHGKFTFMKTMDFKSFEILFQKQTTGFFVSKVYYMNGIFVFFCRTNSKSCLYLYDTCKAKLEKVKDNLCDLTNSCHFEVINFIPEQNKLYFHSSSFTHMKKLFVLEIDKERHYMVEKIQIKIPKHIVNISSKYEEKIVILKNKTIQITLIHKKGLKLHHCKCVLYGYGAYGDHYDSTFNPSNIITLCDMGFLVVIAQISGDRTLGFEQRKRGMLLQKKNTFYDFIYIIQNYLFKRQLTCKDKLTIWGRSAGGLLICAVLNMVPDICKVAILGVPFISPFLTMQSHKNPLGFESHSEWGNPLLSKNADYIESYSPYQNIMKHGNYPHMFIYSNLNDTLVPYTEPYMYYHALCKEADVYKNKEKDICLHIEDKFGHSQGSSLKDKNYQYALIFAFIQKYIK